MEPLYVGNLREVLVDDGIQIKYICGSPTSLPFSVRYKRGKISGSVRIHPKTSYEEMAKEIKGRIEEMEQYKR